jgi:hypothetical protein
MDSKSERKEKDFLKAEKGKVAFVFTASVGFRNRQ